ATIINRGDAIHNGIWNGRHDCSGDKHAKLAKGNNDT
ncbi:hypothetical protein A2U01_0101386, partial [Trifolium medium]|nr:hypothetical protein [Trifolium medium]